MTPISLSPVRSWVAASVGFALVALAGATAWLVVVIHDPHGMDPHWSGAGTAALFAAGFLVRAEYAVVRLARSRTSVWAASWWIFAALVALFVLFAVAVAGNLGG